MSNKSCINKKKKIIETEQVEEEKNENSESDLIIGKKELIMLNNEIVIAEERLEQCQLDKEVNEFELKNYISTLDEAYNKQMKKIGDLENKIKLLEQESITYKNKKHVTIDREKIDPEIKKKNFEKQLNERKKESLKRIEEFKKKYNV